MHKKLYLVARVITANERKETHLNASIIAASMQISVSTVVKARYLPFVL